MRGATSLLVRVQIGGPDGRVTSFTGRVAQTLCHLVQAGELGITPITHPQPRTSHYILMLRRAGLVIETIDEPHGGSFAGSHARYVLRTPVKMIERSGATVTPAAAPILAGGLLNYGARP